MLKRFVAFILMITMACMFGLTTNAITTGETGTFYTYTPSIEGSYMHSRDGFLPSDVLLFDAELSDPQDICYKNGQLYIADTGNQRVIVYTINSKSIREIGKGLLTAPTGVSADDQGRIYVADKDDSKAYRFSASGKVEQVFSKPSDPAFGKKSVYKPSKIVPSDDGGVYISGEGAYSGIIQLNGQGEFLGYFATNSIHMSFLDMVKELIYTDKQKQSMLNKEPPSFSNLTKGSDGLLYTITDGDNTKIKKHSISGINMFPEGLGSNWSNIKDIAVSDDGMIYTVNEDGFIDEFASNGSEMQYFGGPAQTPDRVGLVSTPSGIAVDEQNKIYVLDRTRGCVQTYYPCAITWNVHNAIQLYNNGKYNESKDTWQQVLDQNNMSSLAHVGIAKAYLQQQNYQSALQHFKIAGDKDGYSTSYWEIRNQFLTENASWILLFILVLVVLIFVCKLLNRKTNVFKPVHEAAVKAQNIKFLSDIRMLKYSLVHPMDTCYEISHSKVGSYGTATLLYFGLFIIYLLFRTESGFLLSASSLQEYPIMLDFCIFVSLIVLWNVGNYLIGSIHDGEGKFKTVYISTAYMLAPLLLFMPFIIIISNFLTNTESFLISFSIAILLVWCVSRIFVSVVQIHNYTNGETLKNILLTLFFMIVVTLAVSVLYLLIGQMFQFIISLVKEVFLHG